MRKLIFNIFSLFLLFMTFGKSLCCIKLPLDVLTFDAGGEEILFEWLDANLITGDFAVNFEGGRLDSKQVANLIVFLKGSYRKIRVTSVDFSNIKFVNESDLISIISILPDTSIYLLDLSGHFFSIELVTQLIESIPKSEVRVFRCLNCSINDEKARGIARIFTREHKLFLINLANNNIGDYGAAALICCNSPKIVNLNDNNIRDNGIIDIIKSIIDEDLPIESLLVARNKFGNKAVGEIFKKLKKLPDTFRQINLSGIQITNSLLNNFSGQDEAMTADEIDMYIYDRSMDNRVGFMHAVYGSEVTVIINSWEKCLLPDVYNFIEKTVNSEWCLLYEYPWLMEEEF